MHRPQTLTTVIIIWLTASEALFSAAVRQEVSAETQAAVKVVRGLTERRLFDLVDVYCSQVAISETIDVNERYLIIIEQMKSAVSEATVSLGSKRANAWQKAERIASQFIQNSPDDPNLLLIRLQTALTHFSHGNVLLQELKAEIADGQAEPRALQQFRYATIKFRELEKIIIRRIPNAKSESSSLQLTQDQLINLKNNIRYRLAATNLAKSQLYADDDRLNRIDALSQVQSRLNEVITQSNQSVPLWWEAQISLGRCLRLKSDALAYRRWLNSLPKEKNNADVSAKLLTEQMHGAVAFNQYSVRAELLKQYSAATDVRPELRLAALRLVMAESENAESAKKERLQQQAIALVKQIENEYGPYWGRRAEIEIVGAIPTTGGPNRSSGNYEILIRQGDNAFRKQNFKSALQAFEKARDLAINSGIARQALTMAVRAAQCHEQMKQPLEAAKILIATAKRFRQDESANVVHLRGCWNLGQQSDQNEWLIEELLFQIGQWPDSDAANQAKIWLGGAYERLSRWQDAIEIYLGVAANHRLAGNAADRVAVVADIWVDSERKNGGSGRVAARNLNDRIAAKLATSDWSPANQKLQLLAIEIGLKTSALEPDLALKALQQMVAEIESSVKPEITAWIAVAQAKQCATLQTAIEPCLEAIRGLPNEPVLLRNCLEAIKICVTKEQLPLVADAIEMLCDKAMAEGEPVDQSYWVTEKAIATASTGRIEPLQLGQLKKLAAEKPQSLQIQIALARALTAVNDENATSQWRIIANNTKKASEAWYEAKYHVALLLKRSGDQQRANKLIKYLSLTTKGWSESKWLPRFNELIED